MTTATATTNNSNSSSERFNPMEEPEGIHQQAKLAIDSLKTAMGATSAGGATTASLGLPRRPRLDVGLIYRRRYQLRRRASVIDVRLVWCRLGYHQVRICRGPSGRREPVTLPDRLCTPLLERTQTIRRFQAFPGTCARSWASGGTIGTAVGGGQWRKWPEWRKLWNDF